jgi:hypothetical protein
VFCLQASQRGVVLEVQGVRQQQNGTRSPQRVGGNGKSGKEKKKMTEFCFKKKNLRF